jgi:hypothetical protein
MHLETITMTNVAPGAAGAAATAVTGDTLNIRNAKPGTAIRALAIWSTLQAAGFVGYTTPSGHDTTRGDQTPMPTLPNLVKPLGTPLPFQPQETISPTIAGSAVALDVEQMSFLMLYEDLPGIDTSRRLKRWDEVQKRIVRNTTVRAPIVSAAGPGYSGTALINASSNLLRAYTNYAVLGFSVSTNVHAVGIVGPDTGNQRVCCPGMATKPEITSQWFAMLSRAYDQPLIPIISSGNKDSTNIFVHTDENAGTFQVALHLGLIDGEI